MIHLQWLQSICQVDKPNPTNTVYKLVLAFASDVRTFQNIGVDQMDFYLLLAFVGAMMNSQSH